MSSFTQPLDLRFLDRPLREAPFMLLHEFGYYVGEEGSDDLIVVPGGYCTDFASIPRLLWSVLSPVGRHGKAAVVHDWLYSNNYAHGHTRTECDKVFREAMLVLGVPGFTARLMYRGVRIGGWRTWNRNLKRGDENGCLR